MPQLIEIDQHYAGSLQRRSGTAAVRREVLERDGARCTFVDDSGQRCRETRFLELHHVLAHARRGEAVAHNLTLRCHAHNALAAEQDFGREFIQERVATATAEKPSTARSPP